MIELHEIAENYSRFDDTKIRRIAKKEAKGLRAGVVPILIHEVKKRGLGKNLIEWIHASRRILSLQELAEIKTTIRQANCPCCKKQDHPLVGGVVSKVISFLVITSSTSEYLIVCETCFHKKRKNATLWTLLLGWWSIEGLFTMPFYLFELLKTSLTPLHQNNTIVEAFIHDNIEKITLANDRAVIINKLLKAHYKARVE